MGRDKRTEDVEGLKVTEKAIFVHGTQDVETWNAVISLENGTLSGSISNADSSLAIFGNCTKPVFIEIFLIACNASVKDRIELVAAGTNGRYFGKFVTAEGSTAWQRL